MNGVLRRTLLSVRHVPLLHPRPTTSFLRLFSTSQSDPPPANSASDQPPESESGSGSVPPVDPEEDVSNTEFKRRIELYAKGDEDALPSIMEAILKRKLSGKHEDTDDELMDELRFAPPREDDRAKDEEFESDFEELYSTDEEVENLYSARDIVTDRLRKDEFFNMDSDKWDGMIKEATEKGFLKDTKECEDILEDMLSWDKLLPAEIKQKVEARFNELGDMCERGEMEPEKAYELFKEFEDKMVLECVQLMEAEQPPEEDEIAESGKKVKLDDPPGEGPVLRWESRVVFAPGGDAWHPKNRKVKLSVTVKELELSRHAFHRLREVVGKRYHSGRDELTITSERFEHREENRKDCLRTLYALIEDAMKADALVEETRNAYVKDPLKANPKFMERLMAKKSKMIESAPAPM